MASPETTVGVVGIGELGSKLDLQVRKAGFEPIVFDPFNYTVAKRGINPWLRENNQYGVSRRADSVEQVFEEADILHWTARPSKVLDLGFDIPQDLRLFLHSSVMSESIQVAEYLKRFHGFLGKVTVAHCSMNFQLGVTLASDYGDSEFGGSEHMKELGLNPVLLHSVEHDEIMWHTQGLALRISERQAMMNRAHELGILPPSAERVRSVIDKNNTRWTETTRGSLATNPFNRRRHGDSDSLLDV